MQQLTKEESKWLKKLQKVLDECPSTRLGFYTMGDPFIGLYNLDFKDETDEFHGDLIHVLQREGWGFEETIDFPSPVEEVCG